MEFGEYLRLKRAAKGLTIRQLAFHAGCTESYLSLLERGERGKRGPSPTILKRISVPLGVPYEVLMAAAGYPSEASGGSTRQTMIVKLLRESLGDTMEEFAARMGLQRDEVEILERQDVSSGTLRWIYHRLFEQQRSLSSSQKALVHKIETIFSRDPSSLSIRLERLLHSFLDIDEDI